MRTITADVLKSDYKLPFPVSIICSGSSGAGKTSFIENLIRYNGVFHKIIIATTEKPVTALKS